MRTPQKLINTCPCRFVRRRQPPETQHSNRHSYFDIGFKMKGTTCGTLILFSLYLTGCGGSATPNSNTNANLILITSNSNMNPAMNSAGNTKPINIPSEFSAQPIRPTVNDSAAPAYVEPLPEEKESNHESPRDEELKKTPTPRSTPTPGIPSRDELRKMLNQRPANANVSISTNNNVPMTKTNRPLGGRLKP